MNDQSMHGQETGRGQVCMAAYKDSDSNWLDGATNYKLHVPADVPAAISSRSWIKRGYCLI